MMVQYALKGNRQGWVIDPKWRRTDCKDGYTEFHDGKGECKAVYLTKLLGGE